MNLTDDLSNFLIESLQSRIDFVVILLLLFRSRFPHLEILDRVDSRGPHVAITSRNGSFSIVLVSFERDRIEVVTSDVGTGDLERLTDDRLAKDLLEREVVGRVEREFFDPAIRFETSVHSSKR